jgi:hypothetical protein
MFERSRRPPRIVIATALAAAIIGCGSKASAPADATNVAAARAHPCGTAHGRHAHYTHVVWIVMENTSFTGVIGSADAPYLNSLAKNCGLATNFYAEDHPSLPNYLAMTSGSTQGISDDDGPSSRGIPARSLFGQLGSKWRALAESMHSNCQRSDGNSYVAHHNPPPYYADARNQCAASDVPLGARPDISARFTFITPNNCHNMHSCSVATGDAWLKGFLPKVFHTRQYRSRKAAVFLTWDEGDESQRIATFVMSPTTRPGARSGTLMNHYSLLRTTEELLKLPLLGKAASAPSMRRAFGL